jgi:starch phosphorylase
LKLRGYHPREVPEKNASLQEILNFIESGALAGGDRNLFRPFIDRLLDEDPFLVLADYQAYVDCQEQVSALWRDQKAWTRKAILNVARMGKFSSDRSIRDYCGHVWRVKPVKVPTMSTVARTRDDRGYEKRVS